MPTFVGLDMSLTRSGLGLYSREHGHRSESLRGGDDRGIIRLRTLANKLDEFLDGLIDLQGAAIEGYSFGSPFGKRAAAGMQGVRDGAEWQGAARLTLARRNIPVVIVPPKSLKKFATGNGNAEKEDVTAAAIKRYGFKPANHDEADGMTLAHMAYAKLCNPSGLMTYSLDALEGVELAF